MAEGVTVERKVGWAEGCEGTEEEVKVGGEDGETEVVKEGGEEGSIDGVQEKGRVGQNVEGAAERVLEGTAEGAVGERVGLTEGLAVVGLMVLGTGAPVGWEEGDLKG